MNQADIFTGGCVCGAIRYRAAAAPMRGVICHCEQCRRHSGAPCLAFAHFPAERFAWTQATPKWYRSSQYAERGFCPQCGSTLAMREEVLSDRVQICVGTLDDAARIRIDDHVWTQARIPWFEVRDDLPRFARSSTAVASKA
jgi:hypothetical protein